MKKFAITILVGIILCISICFLELNLCKLTYSKNMKESEKILDMAYSLMEDDSNINNSNILMHNKFVEKLVNNNATLPESICQVSNEDVLKTTDNMGIIGVLKIPKLQVEAPIKEGTSQEVMRTSIGHFTESDYWNGNVSLASHNSGTSAHYFEKINTLNIADEIEYTTKLGTKKYKVESIKQIESTDWSMVLKNKNQGTNEKNTITLITCINGKPNARLCVRGIEL